MESTLFSSQSVGRLLDCTSTDAAFKALTDMGFGSGASVADGNFDALFGVEEARAALLPADTLAVIAAEVETYQRDYAEALAACQQLEGAA